MPLVEKVQLLYRAWRYRFKLDPQEISFLLGNVSAGQTCVDIGAHKGAYTYWMQRAVGPTGRIGCRRTALQVFLRAFSTLTRFS